MSRKEWLERIIDIITAFLKVFLLAVIMLVVGLFLEAGVLSKNIDKTDLFKSELINKIRISNSIFIIKYDDIFTINYNNTQQYIIRKNVFLFVIRAIVIS